MPSSPSRAALYVFILTVLPLVLAAGAVDSSVSFTEVETMQEVNEIRRTQGPVQFWLTYLATPEEMALLRAAESVQLELDELSRRVADESKLHRTALVEAKQSAIAKRNAILSTVTVPTVSRGTRGGTRRSDDGTNVVQRVPFWGALLSRAPNAARYLMTEEQQSELATEHLQFVAEKWIQQTIRNESSVVVDPKFCLLQPFDEEHAVLRSLAKVECTTAVNSTTASLQWKDAPGVPFLFTTKEWSLRVASISDHRLYHLEELEMSVSAERDGDFSEGTWSLEGEGEREMEDATTEEEAIPFSPSAATGGALAPMVTNLRLSDELRRTGPAGDVYEQLQRQARQKLLRQLDDRLAEVLAGVDSTKVKSHVLSERAKLHDAQVELSLVDGSFFGMFTTERIGCKMDTINEPLAAAARGFVHRARERRQRATSFFLQDLCGLLNEIPTEFYDQLKAAEEVELQSDDDHPAEL